MATPILTRLADSHLVFLSYTWPTIVRVPHLEKKRMRDDPARKKRKKKKTESIY